MAIDETQRDEQAVGVDGALCHRPDASDLDDPTIFDADIAAITRGARAVDDHPMANHQLKPPWCPLP